MRTGVIAVAARTATNLSRAISNPPVEASPGDSPTICTVPQRSRDFEIRHPPTDLLWPMLELSRVTAGNFVVRAKHSLKRYP